MDLLARPIGGVGQTVDVYLECRLIYVRFSWRLNLPLCMQLAYRMYLCHTLNLPSCICQSPNWNEPHTASRTPRFGIFTNPYPNQFGESQFQYGDCFVGVFQSPTRSEFSHQKLRQSQRHGAPLLTKNLGNQHTAPANQELDKQEKGRLLRGWLLLTSQSDVSQISVLYGYVFLARPA